MQLPPSDEIVMVAGTPPIRASKARSFENPRFQEGILPPPELAAPGAATDDWSPLPLPAPPEVETGPLDDHVDDGDDPMGPEHRRQPELSRARAVEKAKGGERYDAFVKALGQRLVKPEEVVAMLR